MDLIYSGFNVLSQFVDLLTCYIASSTKRGIEVPEYLEALRMQRFRFSDADGDFKIQILELCYLCGAGWNFVLIELGKQEYSTCISVLNYLKDRLEGEEMVVDFFNNCVKCVEGMEEEEGGDLEVLKGEEFFIYDFEC